MEVISIIISIIALIIVVVQQSRITNLEEHLVKLKKSFDSFSYYNKKESFSINETIKKTEIKEDFISQKPQDLTKVEKLETPKNTPAVIVKNSKMDILLEKFLKNWTGVLGTIILVMGFGFLGIYVALNMSAFSRFLMFVGVFVIMIFISLRLEQKEVYTKTALWLKSGAGAIFLFSCVGSAGIPGLQWVDNNLAGLVLLIIGIGVNLSLGYISGREIVSSIHVFLSLLAISIAPPTLSVFYVASIVTTYGIYLTYRKNWDSNLIFIITLYFVYHLYWFNLLLPEQINKFTMASALITIVFIFFFTLFVHYRKVYSISQFQLIPFLTHFLNWIFLGTGLYLYSSIIPAKIILLVIGSIISLFIAKRAKSINVRWLFVTDSLVANLLMILAILSFYPKGVNPFFISSILCLESIVFTIVVTIEKESLLCKISYLINLVTGLMVFVTGIMIEEFDTSTIISNITIFTVLAVSFILYVLFGSKSELFKSVDGKFKNLVSIIFPLLVFNMFINFYDEVWGSWFLLLLIPIIILKNKRGYKSLSISIKVVTIFSLLTLWFNVYTFNNLETIIYFLPAIITSLFLAVTSFGIYLLQAHLLFISYRLTQSEYLTGTIWLGLSIINLELSRLIKRVSPWLRRSGLIIIAISLIRHFILFIDNDSQILMSSIIVGVLLYWLIRSKDVIDKNSRIYLFVNNHLLELIYIFIITTVILEVELNWQPVVWTSTALATLFFRKSGLSRIRLYSLFLTWLGSFHLAFIIGFGNNYLVPGFIVIGLSTAYLINFNRFSDFQNIFIPQGLTILEKIRTLIIKNHNKYVYFPFFISVAIFILFNANSNIMTLLFVCLSLIIFILSIRLKESSFRVISLLGIAGCLVRLLLFDLTNSGTVIRSLVFIGMGIIMLFMNIIYNKFRE